MPVPLTDHIHYEILELQPDATDDEIRVAYKRLALKWHPDRHQDDKDEAQKKFVEIKEAYLELLEIRQRRERKRKGRKAKEAPSQAPSSTSVPSSVPSESSSADSQETFAPKEQKPRKDSHTKHKSYRPPDPLNVEFAAPKSPPQPSVKLSHHEQPTFSHMRSEHDDSSERDEEVIPKKPHVSHNTSSRLEDMDYEFVDRIDLGSPLHPLRAPQTKDNLSKDWVFSLPVSLEDLHRGAYHHYRITRTLCSGTTQSVKIDVKISPNWKTGTRIRVPGVGNERRGGTFQDIVFVVEERPHPMYSRVGDDLVVSVQVPWANPRTRPYPPTGDRHHHHRHHNHRDTHSSASDDDDEEEVYIRALDGEEYALPIPRSLVEGADGTRITGAGMPIRKRGKTLGRGDLIVKWDFIFPESDKGQRVAWTTFKKAMHWRL